MKYLMTGDPAAMANVIRECRLLTARGLISFAPVAEGCGAEDGKEASVADSKEAPAADAKTPRKPKPKAR